MVIAANQGSSSNCWDLQETSDSRMVRVLQTQVDDETLEFRFQQEERGYYYRFVAGSPESARQQLLIEHNARAAFGLAPRLDHWRDLQLISLHGFSGNHSYYGVSLQAIQSVLRGLPDVLRYVVRRLRDYPQLSVLDQLNALADKLAVHQFSDIDSTFMLYLDTLRQLHKLGQMRELSQHRGSRHQAHRLWYANLSLGAKTAIVLCLGIVLGALLLLVLHKIAIARTRSEQLVGRWSITLFNQANFLRPNRSSRRDNDEQRIRRCCWGGRMFSRQAPAPQENNLLEQTDGMSL